MSQFESNAHPLWPVDFEAKIPGKFLQTDYKILKAALEEACPNLYRYNSQEETEAFFNSQLCALEDSLRYLDFIGVLAKTFNFMACGHSAWSHHPDFYAYRDTGLYLFPFDISLEEHKLFIKQNYSADPFFKAGTEIRKINGIDVQEHLKQLKAHTYKDGQAAPNNTVDVAASFRNAFANFISQTEVYQVEGFQEKPFNISVQGIQKRRLASLKSSGIKKAKPAKLLQFSYLDSSMATYRITWFRNEGIAARAQNFNHFTDSVFMVLQEKPVDTLVIDLRGNVGGWTANGAKLLSYLITEEQSYIDQVQFKKLANYSFEPIISHYPGISDTMEFKEQDGLWEWLNYPSLRIKPAELHFEGEVIILIDEMTRSAAGIFSAVANKSIQPLFIGAENASAQGGQGGMIMGITLPCTGVPVYFSTAKYTVKVGPELRERGIQSDYPNLEAWLSRYPQSALAHLKK